MMLILMSKDDIVSRNKEDMSSIVAKIHDIERQMLEGKLVLVGDDEIPLKPLNVDGQATIMDHFPCLSDTMNVANFRTLIALACNEADVAVSVGSVQEVKERFETSVYYG
ncbi:hypothetical protein Tco_0314177 [Tanacetum coccineum]